MFSSDEVKPLCGKNEIYTRYSSGCQATCNNTLPRFYCKDIVRRGGCVCEKGYVRERIGGPCILLRQCKGTLHSKLN